jgi:hypothetical protein
MSRFFPLPIVVLISVFVCPVVVFAEEQEMPWDLRDHFTFSVNKSHLHYDVTNAEWGLDLDGVGELIDHAAASVTFADGTTINLNESPKESTERAKFTNEYGDGEVYNVDFLPRPGLRIRHTVRVMLSQPFFMLGLEIINEGDKPIGVTQVVMAHLSGDSLKAFDGEAHTQQRRLVMHGPLPVYKKDGHPLLIMERHPEADFALALGFLPLGVARSHIALESETQNWPCTLISDFDPVAPIQPGESLHSDPVWLSFSLPQPNQIDMLYSWTHSVLPTHDDTPTPGPDSWVGARPGAPYEELHKNLAAWKGGGIEHALIPAGWEGRPGSLNGVVPAYPRNIKEAAKTIKKMKYKAGLTVDPLAVTGGDDAWIFAESNGTRWINPAINEARAYASRRLQRVVKGSFSFLALQPTKMPEAALRKFGITRTQAEVWSFDIAEQALGGEAVYPAAASSIPPTLDALLEASSDTGRLLEYGIKSGPLQVSVAPSVRLDESTLAALALYGGPIEYTGAPHSSARKKIAKLHPRPTMYSRPLDFRSPAPKLWFVQKVDAQGVAISGVMAAFAGAPAFKSEDFDLRFDGPIGNWVPDDGSLVARMGR